MKNLNSSHRAAWIMLLVGVLPFGTALAGEPLPSRQASLESVSQLLRSNLANHPELSAIKADLQSAKAALRASDNAIYNPELEFEYEDTDVKTKVLGISQTIDWGDQQGSRTAIAQAELNRAIADYQMAIQSLIKNQLSLMADNQTSQELNQLNNEKLGLMEGFKQIAERRYQAGDVNQVELNLARLAYSQALMERANAQANATHAREKLRALLVNFPSDLPRLPEQLPEPKLDSDLETFLQSLPAIQSQLAELDVARLQVNLRKSEKAWNPTIGVSAGSEGDENLIGFNLSIPLNVRNSYSAEVDAAQQLWIANEQRAHLVMRDTRARLLSTFERYRSLLSAWNTWRKQSRDSVEQQLVLIKKLWLAGDISAADYLLQLKQALETRATGLELRNQLWQAAFEWMSLTASIDNWMNIDTKLLGKN